MPTTNLSAAATPAGESGFYDEHVEDNSKEGKNKRTMLFAAAAMLILVIVVSVTAGGGNDVKGSKKTSSSGGGEQNLPGYKGGNPTGEERLKVLEDILVEYSPDVTVENSTQREALIWLAEKDPYEIPVWEEAAVVTRYVMGLLYASLGIPDARSWFTSCHWDHVGSCDEDNAAILSLQLSGIDLAGQIPSEIGLLTDLKELWMHKNIFLSGTIPTEIGNLVNLERFSLQSNALTGTIPVEIGKLTNLQQAYLGNNQLTGTIPEEFVLLSNLQKLWIHSNFLTGDFPEGFDTLNMEECSVGSNCLTGTSEMCDYSNEDHCAN